MGLFAQDFAASGVTGIQSQRVSGPRGRGIAASRTRPAGYRNHACRV